MARVNEDIAFQLFGLERRNELKAFQSSDHVGSIVKVAGGYDPFPKPCRENRGDFGGTSLGKQGKARVTRGRPELSESLVFMWGWDTVGNQGQMWAITRITATNQ